MQTFRLEQLVIVINSALMHNPQTSPSEKHFLQNLTWDLNVKNKLLYTIIIIKLLKESLMEPNSAMKMIIWFVSRQLILNGMNWGFQNKIRKKTQENLKSNL